MRLDFINSFLQSKDNLFGHEKIFQIIFIALPTDQGIKLFTFIFQGFCLDFKLMILQFL